MSISTEICKSGVARLSERLGDLDKKSSSAEAEKTVALLAEEFNRIGTLVRDNNALQQCTSKNALKKWVQVLHTSLNHSNPIVKSAGIELIAISAKQFSVESLSHALPTWNVAIVKVIRHECAKEGLYMNALTAVRSIIKASLASLLTRREVASSFAPSVVQALHLALKTSSFSPPCESLLFKTLRLMLLSYPAAVIGLRNRFERYCTLRLSHSDIDLRNNAIACLAHLPHCSKNVKDIGAYWYSLCSNLMRELQSVMGSLFDPFPSQSSSGSTATSSWSHEQDDEATPSTNSKKMDGEAAHSVSERLRYVSGLCSLFKALLSSSYFAPVDVPVKSLVAAFCKILGSTMRTRQLSILKRSRREEPLYKDLELLELISRIPEACGVVLDALARFVTTMKTALLPHAHDIASILEKGYRSNPPVVFALPLMTATRAFITCVDGSVAVDRLEGQLPTLLDMVRLSTPAQLQNDISGADMKIALKKRKKVKSSAASDDTSSSSTSQSSSSALQGQPIPALTLSEDTLLKCVSALQTISVFIEYGGQLITEESQKEIELAVTALVLAGQARFPKSLFHTLHLAPENGIQGSDKNTLLFSQPTYRAALFECLFACVLSGGRTTSAGAGCLRLALKAFMTGMRQDPSESIRTICKRASVACEAVLHSRAPQRFHAQNSGTRSTSLWDIHTHVARYQLMSTQNAQASDAMDSSVEQNEKLLLKRRKVDTASRSDEIDPTNAAASEKDSSNDSEEDLKEGMESDVVVTEESAMTTKTTVETTLQGKIVQVSEERRVETHTIQEGEVNGSALERKKEQDEDTAMGEVELKLDFDSVQYEGLPEIQDGEPDDGLESGDDDGDDSDLDDIADLLQT